MPYLFKKNIFGDVTHIIDTNGNVVGAYKYTAYGECQKVIDVNGMATLNPIRYRGYYYDEETALYYLQSRYYDPELCRFITVDDVSYASYTDVNGLNLYSYCLNNPVMNIDPEGHLPEWLGTTLKIVGGIVIIAGAIIASVFTGGTASVIFAGAAIGAIAGGLGAGISTAISGGNIHDFGNAFLVGTITGGGAGAVAASGVHLLGQVLIGAASGALSYVGNQLLNGDSITIGGIAINAVVGAVSGFVGGKGWMLSGKTAELVNTLGRNALKQIFSLVGVSSVFRIFFPSVIIGGLLGGLYEKFISTFNHNGNFFGL